MPWDLRSMLVGALLAYTAPWMLFALIWSLGRAWIWWERKRAIDAVLRPRSSPAEKAGRVW